MYESHFLLWKNLKTRWVVSWILRHGCSITQSYQQRVKYMWCSQKCEEDGDKCGCRSGWHSRELHAVGPVYSDAWDIQFRVSSYTSEPLGDLWLKSVGVFFNILSYFDECVSELMWDHQLFYGVKFQSNSRGKKIYFYHLFLFVIHLWMNPLSHSPC